MKITVNENPRKIEEGQIRHDGKGTYVYISLDLENGCEGLKEYFSLIFLRVDESYPYIRSFKEQGEWECSRKADYKTGSKLRIYRHEYRVYEQIFPYLSKAELIITN